MKQLIYAGIFFLCISLSVVAHGPRMLRQAAVAGSSSAPNVCYNPTDNNYLTVWFHGVPYFSIIGPGGRRIIGPQAIALANVELFGAPICLYNAIDNQYCVTWTGKNENTQISSTYFIIINAAGTLATQVIAIPNLSQQPTANFTDSWVSHNTQNDQYLFTWLAITQDERANAVFAIYDAHGNAVVPATAIGQSSLLNTSSYPIFSSYNSVTNQYFVTWMAQAEDESYRAYFVLLDKNGRVVVTPTKLDNF